MLLALGMGWLLLQTSPQAATPVPDLRIKARVITKIMNNVVRPFYLWQDDHTVVFIQGDLLTEAATAFVRFDVRTAKRVLMVGAFQQWQHLMKAAGWGRSHLSDGSRSPRIENGVIRKRLDSRSYLISLGHQREKPGDGPRNTLLDLAWSRDSNSLVGIGHRARWAYVFRYTIATHQIQEFPNPTLMALFKKKRS